MKFFYPSELQLKALAAKKLSQIWLPMKVQPHAKDCQFLTVVSSTSRNAREKPFRFATVDDLSVGKSSERFTCPYLLGDIVAVKETWFESYQSGVQYRASSSLVPMRWFSPVTMPLWAVRYRLKIISLCAKRVQDLTEEDAVAAGELQHDGSPFGLLGPRQMVVKAQKEFAHSWDSRHGKKPALSWDNNPWCWVYGVESCSQSCSGAPSVLCFRSSKKRRS